MNVTTHIYDAAGRRIGKHSGAMTTTFTYDTTTRAAVGSGQCFRDPGNKLNLDLESMTEAELRDLLERVRERIYDLERNQG